MINTDTLLNTVAGRFKYCPECGRRVSLPIPGGDKLKYEITDTVRG